MGDAAMHTIPPSVLDEMLASHTYGSFPAFNLGFFGANTERVLGSVAELLGQPGFAFVVAQVYGAGWIEQTSSLSEALDELACRGMPGAISFQVSLENEVVFDHRSTLDFHQQTVDVEFVFYEERLNVVERPGLWHRMVEYACHAARMAGSRCIFVYDGTIGANDTERIMAGRDPSRHDQIIWLDR